MKIDKLTIYLFVSVIFYLFIFALRVFDLDGIAKYAIPVYVLMVFLYSLTEGAKDTKLVSAALFFAFVADGIINFVSINGVIVFCATHLCLIAFYLKRKALQKKEWLYFAPLLVIGAIYCMAVLGHVESPSLRMGIPVYLLLLSVMLWRALCLIRDAEYFKIIVGSLLFYITDISVIMGLAYGGQTALNIETWLVYPPALFLLSLIGKNTSQSLSYQVFFDSGNDK